MILVDIHPSKWIYKTQRCVSMEMGFLCEQSPSYYIRNLELYK